MFIVLINKKAITNNSSCINSSMKLVGLLSYFTTAEVPIRLCVLHLFNTFFPTLVLFHSLPDHHQQQGLHVVTSPSSKTMSLTRLPLSFEEGGAVKQRSTRAVGQKTKVHIKNGYQGVFITIIFLALLKDRHRSREVSWVSLCSYPSLKNCPFLLNLRPLTLMREHQLLNFFFFLTIAVYLI